MPRCYWDNLCDCPETTPAGQTCTEHQGINCSIYNGTVISEARQVVDANTTMLEAAIAAMDDDERRLEAIRSEAERIRQDAANAEGEVRAARDRINSNQAGVVERVRIADRVRAVSQ